MLEMSSEPYDYQQCYRPCGKIRKSNKKVKTNIEEDFVHR